MRTDSLLYAHALYKFLDVMEHRYARERFLQALADEDIILEARFYGNPVTVLKIGLKLGNGTRRYGHKALLATLACNTYELLLEIEVGHEKRAKLRHAEATAVENLDDCPVPLPLARGKVYCVYYVVNLLRYHLLLGICLI